VARELEISRVTVRKYLTQAASARQEAAPPAVRRVLPSALGRVALVSVRRLPIVLAGGLSAPYDGRKGKVVRSQTPARYGGLVTTQCTEFAGILCRTSRQCPRMIFQSAVIESPPKSVPAVSAAEPVRLEVEEKEHEPAAAVAFRGTGLHRP